MITNSIALVTKKRLMKFNFILTAEISQKITSEAKKLNQSKSEYLRNVLTKHFNL